VWPRGSLQPMFSRKLMWHCLICLCSVLVSWKWSRWALQVCRVVLVQKLVKLCCFVQAEAAVSVLKGYAIHVVDELRLLRVCDPVQGAEPTACHVRDFVLKNQKTRYKSSSCDRNRGSIVLRSSRSNITSAVVHGSSRRPSQSTHAERL
jgi:hypothetical protein